MNQMALITTKHKVEQQLNVLFLLQTENTFINALNDARIFLPSKNVTRPQSCVIMYIKVLLNNTFTKSYDNVIFGMKYQYILNKCQLKQVIIHNYLLDTTCTYK